MEWIIGVSALFIAGSAAAFRRARVPPSGGTFVLLRPMGGCEVSDTNIADRNLLPRNVTFRIRGSEDGMTLLETGAGDRTRTYLVPASEAWKSSREWKRWSDAEARNRSDRNMPIGEGVRLWRNISCCPYRGQSFSYNAWLAEGRPAETIASTDPLRPGSSLDRGLPDGCRVTVLDHCGPWIVVCRPPMSEAYVISRWEYLEAKRKERRRQRQDDRHARLEARNAEKEVRRIEKEEARKRLAADLVQSRKQRAVGKIIARDIPEAKLLRDRGGAA